MAGTGNRRRALVILAAALAAMAVLGREMLQRQRSSGYREATAVAAGYDQARTMDAGAAEDAQLSDDEGAAGAMWAKAHGLDRASECPTYSKAFHRGCADYLDALAK